MLRDLGFNPYHIHLVHAMTDNDPDWKVDFCEIFRPNWAKYSSFSEKIILSDKSTFKLNGYVNQHNRAYWASANSYETIGKNVNSAGVTV